ncbi:hypothetical protein Barb4_02664 [Bacteroidales bacterium Barb4]|nr:hypothetical protein Barb4_02664 [Bacteroidales bacterium Barb4]
MAMLADLPPVIEEGDVYRIHLTETEGIKPKNRGDSGRHKYIIIVGFDGDKLLGVVLINTAINQTLPQELQDLHYPIRAERYSFLEQSRYVDCGTLIEISKEKYSAEMGKPIAKIDEDDVSLIKGALCNSDRIKLKQLKRFHLI